MLQKNMKKNNKMKGKKNYTKIYKINWLILSIGEKKNNRKNEKINLLLQTLKKKK